MGKNYFHILDVNGFNLCLVLGNLIFIAINDKNSGQFKL